MRRIFIICCLFLFTCCTSLRADTTSIRKPSLLNKYGETFELVQLYSSSEVCAYFCYDASAFFNLQAFFDELVFVIEKRYNYVPDYSSVRIKYDNPALDTAVQHCMRYNGYYVSVLICMDNSAITGMIMNIYNECDDSFALLYCNFIYAY